MQIYSNPLRAVQQHRERGSTLTPIGKPRVVAGTESARYVFEMAIRNWSTLVADGGNLGLKHGTYRRMGETQASNIYPSMLRVLGVEQESFADGRGTFDCPILSRV